MQNVSFKYFTTPDGNKLSRLKGDEDNPIPNGCYFDEGEISNHIKKRLKQDIFPLLEFIEQQVRSEFEIDVANVKFRGCIESEMEAFDSLKELEEFCQKRLVTKSCLGFSLNVEIACMSNTIKWGTCIPVFLHEKSWGDDMEFPVKFLVVSGISLELDGEASIEKCEAISRLVLAALWRCFRIESTGVWED